MKKRMAIIQQARFGLNDRRLGAIGLTLLVQLDEQTVTHHFFSPTEAVELVEAYGVHDVREMVGRPIWVTVALNMVVIDGPCVF